MTAKPAVTDIHCSAFYITQCGSKSVPADGSAVTLSIGWHTRGHCDHPPKISSKFQSPACNVQSAFVAGVGNSDKKLELTVTMPDRQLARALVL